MAGDKRRKNIKILYMYGNERKTTIHYVCISSHCCINSSVLYETLWNDQCWFRTFWKLFIQNGLLSISTIGIRKHGHKTKMNHKNRKSLLEIKSTRLSNFANGLKLSKRCYYELVLLLLSRNLKTKSIGFLLVGIQTYYFALLRNYIVIKLLTAYTRTKILYFFLRIFGIGNNK